MSLKLIREKDWEGFDKQHDEVNVIIEIGEFELAEPAFRKRVRLVAITNHHHVRFALQYQHEGEVGIWLDDPSFPWHGRNFDSIIRAAVRYHERIEKVLKGEQKLCPSSSSP